MPQVGCQVLSLVPVGYEMWGQSITCHNLHHPSPLATLVGIADIFRLGEPEPTTGRMLLQRPSSMSISDARGWPIGMDLCCNRVAGAVRHRMQQGCMCRQAQMQRGLHVPCKRVTCAVRHRATVVHTWCTRTCVLELGGQNGYGPWADTPWSDPRGMLYPSRVTTSSLSYL